MEDSIVTEVWQPEQHFPGVEDSIVGPVPLALVTPLAVLDMVSILVVGSSTLTFLMDEIGSKGLLVGQGPGHAGPDLPLLFPDLVACPTIQLPEVGNPSLPDLALRQAIEACP